MGTVLGEHVFTVVPGDMKLAGNVSSSIKRILKEMGLAEDFVRRVCIACYEVEMNMVIHSWGGFIKMTVYSDKIKVIAEDRGPGIPNIETALEDGYSTAPEEVLKQGFGAGRGMSNMKRYSDEFNITSIFGKGTKVDMIFKIS
jgi:serine/threonine-protein kinase RsbT